MKVCRIGAGDRQIMTVCALPLRAARIRLQAFVGVSEDVARPPGRAVELLRAGGVAVVDEGVPVRLASDPHAFERHVCDVAKPAIPRCETAPSGCVLVRD